MDQKIALILGNGPYAEELIERLSSRCDCVVATLLPRQLSTIKTDVDFYGTVFELDEIIRFLRGRGVTAAVFGGTLGPYRTLSAIGGELLLRGRLFHSANVAYFAAYWRTVGIISILRFIEDRFKASDITPAIASDHLPELKPGFGPMTPLAATVFMDEAMPRLLAVDAIRALSHQAVTRIRQSVVFDIVDGQRRIVGIEYEGTDVLLQQVSRIEKAPGTLRALVKMCPTAMSPILDAPVIGPDTVIRCTGAKINLVVVDCRTVIISRRQSVLDLAKENAICLYGLNAPAI